ncbi:MAG: hypothetical protein FK732_07380 [Asgard group archaeon]|nr:hypothetical protein [Asgard group archaeon]
MSIAFYPGGARLGLDDTVGYTFLYNFISDLGRVTAINGDPNTISHILFATGLILLSLAQISYYFNIQFLIRQKKSSTILGILSAVIGVVSSILYISLALVPYDVNDKLHNKFIYAGAPFVFVAVLVLMIAIFLDKECPNYFAYTWLVLVGLFTIFAIATGIGTSLDRDTNWVIRMLGHTILIFTETIIFVVQGIWTWWFLRKKHINTTFNVNQANI